MVKKSPSRRTGMPDKRSSVTVESAVHSISGGISASPIGTPSSRNASGKVERKGDSAPRRPPRPRRGSSPPVANCWMTCTWPAAATSHARPAPASNRKPRGSGDGRDLRHLATPGPDQARRRSARSESRARRFPSATRSRRSIPPCANRWRECPRPRQRPSAGRRATRAPRRCRGHGRIVRTQQRFGLELHRVLNSPPA